MRDLRAARVAMIFQEPMTALNPVLRVGDQIMEVMELHTDLSAAERRRRAVAIMEQVHLPDVERIFRSYPHQLSGGQRQRIMIAMALVLEPVLLIADEPTTALDVTTQKQILALIDELQKGQGTAVLFITHDMGVVAEIADTVYAAEARRDRSNTAPGRDLAPASPRCRLYPQSCCLPRPACRPAPRCGSDDTVLRVERLNKIYGGGGILRKLPQAHAARDVTFALSRGRTLGIVGESGSGKSTVARCIMRLIDPSSGRIMLDGADIASLPRARAAPAPPEAAGGVPGPDAVAEPPLDHRRESYRGAIELWHQPCGRDGRGRAPDGRRGPARRRAGPLSAPVLGRAAPADRHRPRGDDAP